MTANLAGMLAKARRNELSGEFVVIADEVAVGVVCGGREGGGVVEATTSDCCRQCPLCHVEEKEIPERRESVGKCPL